MRAQPVVAEEEVSVANHIKLHKGRVFIKVAEDQLAVTRPLVGRDEQSAFSTDEGWPAGAGPRHRTWSWAAKARLMQSATHPSRAGT